MGSFPAGSQTTIAIPNVEFPDGYQVSVTGGEVFSAPDLADLVIVSNAEASAVSVTVSAGGLAGRRCRARSAMGRSQESKVAGQLGPGGPPIGSVRLVDHDQYGPGAAAPRHR